MNCWMTLILCAEYGGVCSIDSVQNCLMMSLKIAEIYGFINFYNGSRHPSLIFFKNSRFHFRVGVGGLLTGKLITTLRV